MGRGALLPRPEVLRVPRSHQAVSGWHVVRVLPRRPGSHPSARRSREPALGEPLVERRRAVFLGRSHLQLEGRHQREELLLPAVPHVTARIARYFSCFERQHQQPAHDERGLPARAAHGPGEEVGQGDAGRRRREQPAVQRVRASGRPAGAVLPGAEHDVDAARAQGRIGFGRRARGAQPRVHQHRPVQRGVAHALHAAHRRHGHLADRDLRRAPELGLLGRDRAADAIHGAILPEGVRGPSPAGRARRPRVSHRGRGDGQAGQDRVRRTLRALPLEQDPAAARGTRHGERQRQGLPRRAGTGTGRGRRPMPS